MFRGLILNLIEMTTSLMKLRHNYYTAIAKKLSSMLIFGGDSFLSFGLCGHWASELDPLEMWDQAHSHFLVHLVLSHFERKTSCVDYPLKLVSDQITLEWIINPKQYELFGWSPKVVVWYKLYGHILYNFCTSFD